MRWRGGDDASADSATAAAGDLQVWRTGTAFELTCPLQRPTIPLLFHLDDAGGLQLLYPESPSGPYPIYPRETTLILPPPESNLEWVLEGEGGRELFFLASAEAPQESLETVVNRVLLQSQTMESQDDLEALLHAEIGEVRATVIEHRP